MATAGSGYYEGFVVWVMTNYPITIGRVVVPCADNEILGFSWVQKGFSYQQSLVPLNGFLSKVRIHILQMHSKILDDGFRDE
jgi:hypothetical protein